MSARASKSTRRKSSVVPQVISAAENIGIAYAPFAARVIMSAGVAISLIISSCTGRVAIVESVVESFRFILEADEESERLGSTNPQIKPLSNAEEAPP